MSKDSNHNASSGGIGFCGALTIAFIVLKLCNVIAWSWVWVLSPMWIVLSLVLIILAICALVTGIIALYEHVQMKGRD